MMGSKGLHHTNDPYIKREKGKYKSPIASREFILATLEDKNKPLRFEKLAKLLKISDENAIEALKKRLNAMMRDGQIFVNRRGSYTLSKCLDLVQGRVKLIRDNFSIVEPLQAQSYDEICLSGYQSRELMVGDTILVRPTVRDDKGRMQAVVVDIVSRSLSLIYGVYSIEDGIAFILPVHRHISQTVLVVPQSEMPAKSGDIVCAEIIKYPANKQTILTRVIEVLGNANTAGIESQLATLIHDIPRRFPEEVMTQVGQFPETVQVGEREDWRDMPFVTIDGASAKDFDDAVFASRHPEEGYFLYVAIADVSHYVTKDSALDKEAFKRGTSVYFPDRVIPMLPEQLSNNLCSLKEGVDRYAIGVRIHFSQMGKMLSSSVRKVVISSKARLTYTQVEKMILGKIEIPGWFEWSLQDLVELTKILIECRSERGALEFGFTEPSVKLNSKGKIASISSQERQFSQRLIEECMIACNEAMARKLLEKSTHGMFRNHLPPETDKLNQLDETIAQMGLDPQEGIVQILNQSNDLPQEQRQLLETLLIRSLKQARYEISSLGHFGLSLEHYLHFTSPIRRYPDLMVHRMLFDDADYDKSQLERIAELSSQNERVAEEASRDAMAWLKAAFISNHIGRVFSGVISSVTSFGVFVNIPSLSIDGLVHVTELKNDYYRFDPLMQTLTGEREGQVYSLGQLLKVRCAAVSIWDKKIDFTLCEKN